MKGEAPMSEHDERMEFIRTLMLMEEGLSRLYRDFSRCFPEMRDFWTIISAEEAAHAEWVRILEAKVREGEAQFSDRGASLDLLLVEVRKLEQRIGTVEEKSCSLMDALAMAKEFESSMIERDFFKYFEGESKQVEDTLSRLSAQTREHLDRIMAVFNITRRPLKPKASPTA
jgi:hypothetical protein